MSTTTTPIPLNPDVEPGPGGWAVIRVDTTTGPVAARAQIIGPLAVHRTIDTTPGRPWCVSHLPTGVRIGDFDLQQGAAAFAAWLRDELDGAGLDVSGTDVVAVRDCFDAAAGGRENIHRAAARHSGSVGGRPLHAAFEDDR